MAPITATLNSDGPLDQDLLLDLSRKALRPYLRGDPESPPLGQVKHIWRRLIQSVRSNQGTEKYLTATCNSVSVFLTTSSVSHRSDIKLFAFSRQVWLDGYECARKAFDKGKTKPALQVLETLCQLLSQHSDKQTASTLLYDTTKDQLKPILSGDLQHHVKIACITLSCLVRKTPVAQEISRLTVESLSEVGPAWLKQRRQHNLDPRAESEDPHFQHALFLALLIAIKNLETRSAALKLFALICGCKDDLGTSPGSSWAGVTIQLFVERNGDVLDDFADNVFPVILEEYPVWQVYAESFKSKSTENDSRLLQYLAVLRVGRLKGFISEDDLAAYFTPRGKTWSQKLMHGFFLRLLQANNATVRVHAYSLFIVSHSPRATISATMLECIAKGWRYLHDDNNAHERGEVLSTTRRLLKRIDGASTGLKLNAADHGPINPSPPPIHYLEFIKRFVVLLTHELYPGISYPRHILALQTLELFLSLRSSFLFDLEPLRKPLLNLILDPFEDVRRTATEACKALFCRPKYLKPQSLLWDMAKQAEVLAATTCRHNHADAAGRLLYLAQCIEDPHLPSVSSIERLDDYLLSATVLEPESAFPLHALLLGATHYLSRTNHAWERSHIAANGNVFRVCCRIWHLVQRELCVDSPETATAEFVEVSVGPKDLLAYSWRALRDSSLLLEAMLKAYCIDYEVLHEIGLLCIEQLTMLRHRGAFSTVAHTFTLCCELARSSAESPSKQLTEKWYCMAIHEIGKQGSKLTRRSAGLPALLNAVLSPSNPRLFDLAMKDLKSRATQALALEQSMEQAIEMPQVHALNCIKDIVHDSRLRTVSEQYLAELLELGAGSLSSDVWAIRNSGLMLLKACMTRLEPDGSSWNSTSSVPGAQPPREELFNIVCKLLHYSSHNDRDRTTSCHGVLGRDEVQSTSPTPRSESIFAGLDLVKYIGRTACDSTRMSDFIRHHLGSHIWAIRDHAARVFVEGAEPEENLSAPLSICPLRPHCSENELHGILLFCRYSLSSQRQNHSVDEVNRCLEDLPEMLDTLSSQIHVHSSPFTKAALLDIANDSLSFILNTGRILSDLDSTLLALHHNCGPVRSSHCRARLLLGRTLIYLLNGSELAHRKFVMIGDIALEALSQDVCPHPDEAKFVLEWLQGIYPADSIAQMRLIHFLCWLSKDTTITDVRALALSVLADVLERDEQAATHFCSTQMDETRAELDKVVISARGDTRDLWKASLRVNAYTIRAYVEATRTVTVPTLESMSTPTDQLLNQLHEAGQEATELPTRLVAVTTLRNFAPGIVRSMILSVNHFRLVMKVIVLLYDQLNDDDEQVRSVAGQCTAHVLQGWPGRGSAQPGTPLCSLASREILIELMLEPVHGQDSDNDAIMSRLAIQRMIGSDCGHTNLVEASLENLLAHSVGERLGRIYASMSDLFAEERQNLYIDDLEEVVRWSRVLSRSGLGLSTKSLHLLMDWTSEGLDQIEMALEVEDGKQQTPLGPTYHSEILTMFVRVISLASVVAELLNRPNDHGKKVSLRLKSRLAALKTACVEHQVHERVLMAFTAGEKVDN